MKKMNPVWKRRWVKALRSGEYKQGQGQLRAGRGADAQYCCLGVLCAITGKRYRGTGGMLPDNVMKLVGLTDDDPIIGPKGRSATLLNDACRLSFKQIARLIEKNL
jgi:hypothetical protein